MINPNESRIGNLVYYDNRVFEIDTIAEEFPTLNTIEFGIGVVAWNNIKPIPITEEWLLKFGFEKREGSVCDSFYIGLNPITHDWLFDLVWLKNMMDYSYEGNPFYKNGHHEVKYIHQLQNLYFALTQKELTCK